MAEPLPVVLDSGSGSCRAGFAGGTTPTKSFPMVVGELKAATDGDVADAKVDGDTMDPAGRLVGNEAYAAAMAGEAVIRYPVVHGSVTDWDAVEALWQYALSGLGVGHEDPRHVLLTEIPGNPKAQRERAAEIMFDTLGVSGLYLHVGPVLALYAVGRTTGCVLDAGDGICHTVPVYEGYTISAAVQRLPFGGRDVTETLTRMLTESGYYLNTSAEREIARTLKENACFVSLRYEEDLAESELTAKEGSLVRKHKYRMPDGKEFHLGTEAFRAGEALFQPSLMGIESVGLSDALMRTVGACDIDLRTSMWNHLCLTGGSTMFKNFQQRIAQDVMSKMSYGGKVHFHETPHTMDRSLSVWAGGAILAGLSSFEAQWVTLEDYQEHGPHIVARKCCS